MDQQKTRVIIEGPENYCQVVYFVKENYSESSRVFGQNTSFSIKTVRYSTTTHQFQSIVVNFHSHNLSDQDLINLVRKIFEL